MACAASGAGVADRVRRRGMGDRTWVGDAVCVSSVGWICSVFRRTPWVADAFQHARGDGRIRDRAGGSESGGGVRDRFGVLSRSALDLAQEGGHLERGLGGLGAFVVLWSRTGGGLVFVLGGGGGERGGV